MIVNVMRDELVLRLLGTGRGVENGDRFTAQIDSAPVRTVKVGTGIARRNVETSHFVLPVEALSATT